MTTTDYERLELFQTLSTGEVHRAATYGHGRGPACVERWMLGQVFSGLSKDVTCRRCQGREEATYDVVLPDKRYNTGYRVVHEAVALEDAQRLSEEIVTEQMAKSGDQPLPSVIETPQADE